MATSTVKYRTGLPQDCRPLSDEELSLLPPEESRCGKATVVRYQTDWLLLSAELPDAPQPQTHRLYARLKRSGIEPQICYTSRLQVEAYSRLYARRTKDNSEVYGREPAAATTETAATTAFSDVRDLLQHALQQGASDIHLECRRGKGVRVRLRLHGVLTDCPPELEAEQGEAIAHYLFSLGRRGNRQWQAETACDGVVDIELQPGRAPVQLRLASLPEARGWDLIVRLFVGEEISLSLGNLGYTAEQIQQLQEAFHRPYGAILFAGPTGSGKSTSMLAALQELPADRKIISLEQPVERMLSGASHITALSVGGMSEIAPMLQRWDADVAVVGEIRDADSLRSLSHFTTSGRLTVATLHASSVRSVPRRLMDLGLTQSMLGDASFLTALANQRLLPSLCRQCRIPLQKARLPPWCLKHCHNWLNRSAGQIFVRSAAGCSACHTGVSGRILAAEIHLLQEQDYRLLSEGQIVQWQDYLLQTGMKTLAQRGLDLVLRGSIDPLEAIRLTGIAVPQGNLEAQCA